MGKLISILMDNFIYIAFVCILLILALIGYIVDSTKTSKLKKELTSQDEEETQIPLPKIDPNVTLGSTVNKATTINSNTNSAIGGSTDNQSSMPKK